jgi:hypothetical protein
MSETPNQDYLLTLEELVEKIPAAKQSRSLGSILDKALQAAKDSEQHIHRLEELCEFTKLVMNYLEESDKALIIDKLTELAQIGQITKRAAEIDQLDEIRGKLRDVVPSTIETVERRFSSSWQSHIVSEFSTLGHLGEVLSMIPETTALGQEMAAIHLEAQSIAKDLKSYDKQEPKYRELMTNRDMLHDRLKHLGAGKEVVDFLLAVADEKASLADVTSTVQEWLTGRDALGQFRVGL